MRTGAGRFNPTAAAGPVVAVVHSAWHSPVPYLFGGLAAMMGMIAIALLVLACSYWRLSHFLDDDREEGGDHESGVEKVSCPVRFAEVVVVFMAGDENPTFLATPTASRANSFGERKCCCHERKMDGEKKVDGDGGVSVSIEMVNQEGNNQ